MNFNEFVFIFFGISLVMALVISKGATLLKTPLIVGYIVAGAILGPDALKLISNSEIHSLDLINTLVLSFIGFGVGGELRIKTLKRLGRSIVMIVIFEASFAFLLVAIAVGLYVHNFALGLIYGALASATAPAGTVEVIRQYKAKGDLTTTLYAVMGLDDIYALLIYTLMTPLAFIYLAGKNIGNHVSLFSSLGHAGIEILISIAIGTAVGFILTIISRKIHDRITLFFLSLGIILINCGISEHLSLSPILMNMAAGIVAVNYRANVARKIFDTLGDWSPPFYVWFFVLIGTRLDHHMIIKFAMIIFLYVLARSFGKWAGAYFGAKVSKAPQKTRVYLGFALFSQAGVAIGLALAASKSLESMGLHQDAEQVMSVITATTFIVMLIGPVFAKIALFKSGEATIRK